MENSVSSVWIVVEYLSHYRGEIVGVFATQEAAQKCANGFKEYDVIEIDEWEVKQ